MSAHPVFSDLLERRQNPEEMDDPSLDAPLHFQALEGLARINRWSGSASILWAPIQGLARETGERALRVLDIATGAGDIPIALWEKSRREGFFLEIHGCDKSPQAIEYARKRAQENGATVHFYRRDIIKEEIPPGYDILMSSLFLHHLSSEEALEFLRHMAGAARKMILVNDLVRCASGLVLAYLGTRFLTRSKVVHTDGVRSVQAAFNLQEIHRLARKAELTKTCVEGRWPSRFLLTWKRDPG